MYRWTLSQQAGQEGSADSQIFAQTKGSGERSTRAAVRETQEAGVDKQEEEATPPFKCLLVLDVFCLLDFLYILQ